MPELPDPADWEGFDAPRYTPVPDDLFDLWLARLSGAELKVMLYIIRRTFGFKKNSDPISLDQMVNGIVTRDGRRLDHGAGVARSSAQRVLESLIKRRLIWAEKQVLPDGGDGPTIYGLLLKGADSRYRGVPTIGTGGARLSAGEGYLPSVPQETVTRYSEQEEDQQPELSDEARANLYMQSREFGRKLGLK